MSRQSNIRWRKTDTSNLKRVVKNYNARIRYQEKKDPEYAGERIKYSEIKEGIQSRKDFNKAIKDIQNAAKVKEIRSTRKGKTTVKKTVSEAIKTKTYKPPEVTYSDDINKKKDVIFTPDFDETSRRVIGDEPLNPDYDDYEWRPDLQTDWAAGNSSYDESYRNFLDTGEVDENLHVTKNGLVIPKDQLKEIQELLDSINEKRAERKEQAKEIVSTEKGTMGRLEDADLNPKKNRTEAFKDYESLEKWIEQLRYEDSDEYEQDRAERYLDNYQLAMERNGISEEDQDEILSAIQDVGLDTFIALSYENTFLVPDYLYSKEEGDVIVDKILTELSYYA